MQFLFKMEDFSGKIVSPSHSFPAFFWMEPSVGFIWKEGALYLCNKTKPLGGLHIWGGTTSQVKFSSISSAVAKTLAFFLAGSIIPKKLKNIYNKKRFKIVILWNVWTHQIPPLTIPRGLQNPVGGRPRGGGGVGKALVCDRRGPKIHPIFCTRWNEEFWTILRCFFLPKPCKLACLAHL